MEFREHFNPIIAANGEPPGSRFSVIANAPAGGIGVVELASLMPATPSPGIPALVLHNTGFTSASLGWWVSSQAKPKQFHPDLQLYPGQMHVVRVRAASDQLLLMGNNAPVSVGIILGTIHRVVDLGPVLDAPAAPISAAV